MGQLGSELKKRIERQQKRLREIEAQFDELQGEYREANAYLQALQDTVKLLPQDEQDSIDAEPEITMRDGSNVAQARDVLRKVGQPMHVNEILKAIGKEPNKKDRLSLSGALALYVRREQVFNRPSPNVFGLREWTVKPVAVKPVAAMVVNEQHINATDVRVSPTTETKLPMRPTLHRPLN